MLPSERVVQKPGLNRTTHVDKGHDLNCIVMLSGARGVQRQSDHLHEVKVVEPRAVTHVDKESRLNSTADYIDLKCKIVR